MDVLDKGRVPPTRNPPIRALNSSIAQCDRETFLINQKLLDRELFGACCDQILDGGRCPSPVLHRSGDKAAHGKDPGKDFGKDPGKDFGKDLGKDLGETVRAPETVARNRVVFWQGESHDQEIEIVEGVIRAVHLCESGERQVLAFFWPGTVIRPTLRHVQSYTAEAVTNCILRPRRFARSAEAPGAIGANEQVLHEMLNLLRGISRRSALSRLAWFILRMREHLPRVSPGSDVFKFVIPRSDMADHLGLSLETVSRGLTILKTKGLIDLPSRKTIRFCGLAQLARLEDG